MWGGTLSIKLLPKQELFVYSKHRTTVYYAGRGGGKSFAASFLVANRLTHGKNILGIAPTYGVLSSVLIKCTLDILHAHKWKYKYNKSEKLLVLSNRDGSELSRAYFRSAENPELIRGITDIDVLIMDEAAVCSPLTYDIALACLRGAKVRNPQSFLITTPRGRANWTADIYLDHETLAIHSTLDENTEIDVETFKATLLKRYGEMFARQEIYAEILDSTEDGLFKMAHIDTLKDTPLEPTYGEVVAGFDVAGSGGDFSAITIRQGNTILALEKRRTPDDHSLVDFFDYMYRLYRPSKANIDTGGPGHFLPSRLEPLYPSCAMVGCAFSSREHEGYANLRTKIYFDLREEVIERKLHFSSEIGKELVEEVEVELLATEYELNSRRELALISKDEIKKEISRSPDASDSLALACYRSGGVSREQAGEAMQRLKNSRKVFPSSSRRFK